MMDDFELHITHSIHAPRTTDERAMPHLVIGVEHVKASESGSMIRLGCNLDENNWII